MKFNIGETVYHGDPRIEDTVVSMTKCAFRLKSGSKIELEMYKMTSGEWREMSQLSNFKVGDIVSYDGYEGEVIYFVGDDRAKITVPIDKNSTYEWVCHVSQLSLSKGDIFMTKKELPTPTDDEFIFEDEQEYDDEFIEGLLDQFLIDLEDEIETAFRNRFLKGDKVKVIDRASQYHKGKGTIKSVLSDGRVSVNIKYKSPRKRSIDLLFNPNQIKLRKKCQ